MEGKIKIAVADMNEETGKAMEVLTKDRKDVEMMGYALNGLDAYRMVVEKQPDVLIMDLILPGMDGLDLITKICTGNGIAKKPYIIILSGIKVPYMIENVCEAGAYYYFLKPCDLRVVLSKVLKLAIKPETSSTEKSIMLQEGGKEVETDDMKYQVTEVLREAGIPPHIKGYQYLRDGILMVIKEMDLLNGVTKVLYPAIAKNYSTTPSSVERAMRHAIEVAWNRGNMDALNHIFGSKVQDCLNKPTNSEFIAIVADELRLHRGNTMMLS